MKKSVQYLLLVLLAVLLLGIAGRMDYNESIIYNMPDNVYKVIKAQLGNPSDGKIVDEYLKNREYWEEVAFNADHY